MNDIMKSAYIREENWYTLEELMILFNYKKDITKKLLEKFITYGILEVKSNKKKKSENYFEVDRELVNINNDVNDKYSYKFTFVGIFMVPEIILKCYPKYILNNKEKEWDKLFVQVLKVIEKMNKKKVEEFYGSQSIDNSKKEFNLLETILYLLNDYYEYGVYTNIQEIYEINGIKEINWDKTINEKPVFFSNDVPFYPELVTKKKVEDDYNYIKRLHQNILMQCTKDLKNFGLLELFDIQEIRLGDGKISDLGETEYILNKLEREQEMQYNTRKLILLKVMYNYILNKHAFEDNSEFSFYGTTSFHVIWEKVCSEVLEDKLHKNLGDIDLPKKLIHEHKNCGKLINIIEKPEWKRDGKSILANKSLEPDGISIYKDKNDKFSFIIFDAKYRVIEVESSITGQPGIGEITKQYLYQLAYKEFFKKYGFKKNSIRNCFLMPTEQDKVEKRGIVKMYMLEKLGLKNIQVILLPAHIMYDLYLKNKKLFEIYPEVFECIISEE